MGAGTDGGGWSALAEAGGWRARRRRRAASRATSSSCANVSLFKIYLPVQSLRVAEDAAGSSRLADDIRPTVEVSAGRDNPKSQGQ